MSCDITRLTPRNIVYQRYSPDFEKQSSELHKRRDRRRGLEAGADYYLTKGSFHDDTLVRAVVDLIGEAVT
jgi:CheY-like chemotaxis protein